MASIPLPALDIKPVQQPDALADVSKLMALRSMMTNQQSQQQELQIRAQAVKDQQATTAAMKSWDGKDYNALAKSVLDNGGSATSATAIQQHGLTVQKTVSDIAAQDAATGSKNLETFIGRHKAIGDALEGIENVPDDQLHDAAASKIAELAKGGILQPQEAQQLMQGLQVVQDPKALRTHIDMLAKSSLGAKAVADEAKTAAETAKDTAQARSDNANAAMKEIETAGLKGLTPELINQQVDNVFAPQDPQTAGQNRLLKSRALGLLQGGDLPGAKQALQEGFQSALGIQKDIAVATNPQVQQGKVAVATAEGQARAAVDAAVARGSNAALAQVPPHLVAPATAAATKAGEDYAQAQSVTQRLQAMMDAAKKGNVVSYQLIPEEGALQVTTSQGVHRINMAEIQNYGGGSLWQRLQGHVGKALTGASIPTSVLDDMAEMQKIQAEGSLAKYKNTLKTVNQSYGAKFEPVQMDDLKTEPSQKAPSSAPAGATHTAMGSDGKKHYTNAQGQDLGIAP